MSIKQVKKPNLTMSNFYADLAPFSNIREITTAAHYSDVPQDWLIALTDVRGSTKAIEAGRYREVTAVAAASIATILNAVKRVSVPFVFGGDGVSVVVPPEFREVVRKAMLASRQMAADNFDLDLRISIVPVSHVLEAGYKLRVAKMEVSPNFTQAVFAGGGLSYADKLFKHPEYGAKYAVDGDSSDAEGDFSGFECRWNAVRSKYEETINLLVQAQDDTDDVKLYQDVLDQIDTIYGDKDHRHPLSIKKLKLRLWPNSFKIEQIIRYPGEGFKRLRQMALNTFKARIAMWFNIQNWGQYKQLLIDATDNEKFDDALRMTISGSAAQRAELVTYLESLRQQGLLIYGVHANTHTLVTCIVYDYFGQQVHFVDGSEGGYALAAKGMKQQARGRTSLRLATHEMAEVYEDD